MSNFHREYRSAKQDLEESDAKLAALIDPPRQMRWRLALTFGPVIALACCMFVLDVLRQTLADIHKALFAVLETLVNWSLPASCDTRRMAETGNTGSVRSTGGAVPSEAQADAHPLSDS